jgi:PPM family protein phosphatase
METITWSGLTHPGRFRQNNEDAFLGINVLGKEVRLLGKEGSASINEGDFIFAVSDGMGGANAGEFASRIAIDYITKKLPESYRLGEMGSKESYGEFLKVMFEQVDQELSNMSFYYQECRDMGATLSLCWFTPYWMYFAHVGDSRIYYLPEEKGLIQLSEDDTRPGELFRKGKINERQLRTHPEKHILWDSLGGRTDKVTPQLGAMTYEAGDRFVINSDGINDGVWDRRIEELVRHPPSRLASLPPAERLVKDSLEESGRDNLTAIVVSVT